MHLYICTHTRKFARCFKWQNVFYRTVKVKLIAWITRSTLDRVCNDETRSTLYEYECRANDEGAIDIKDKTASISIWKVRRRNNNVLFARILLFLLCIFPNRKHDFVLDIYCSFSVRTAAFIQGGSRSKSRYECSQVSNMWSVRWILLCSYDKIRFGSVV